MVVVGCCVVPSWPGVLDLDLADLPDTCHQLHVAAKYIGDHVHDLRPDMIVLVSHRYSAVLQLLQNFNFNHVKGSTLGHSDGGPLSTKNGIQKTKKSEKNQLRM